MILENLLEWNTIQSRCDAAIALHKAEICKLSAQRNKVAPILQLPADTFIPIFQRATELSYHPACKDPEDIEVNDEHACNPSNEGSRHYYLLGLARTCKQWHDIVMTMPSLWANIDILYRRSVKPCVKLAKTYPVSVHADLSSALCRNASFPHLDDESADNLKLLLVLFITSGLTIQRLRIVERSVSRKLSNLLPDAYHLGVRSISIPHLDVTESFPDHEDSDDPVVHGGATIIFDSLISLSLNLLAWPAWLQYSRPSSQLRHLQLTFKVPALRTISGILSLLQACSKTVETACLELKGDARTTYHEEIDHYFERTQPIYFSSLETIILKGWKETWASQLLRNIVNAPKAKCTIMFTRPDFLLSFLFLHPITPEWAALLGPYQLRYSESMEVYLMPAGDLRSEEPLPGSSCKFPTIRYAQAFQRDHGQHEGVRRVKAYLTILASSLHLFTLPIQIFGITPFDSNLDRRAAKVSLPQADIVTAIKSLPHTHTLHLVALSRDGPIDTAGPLVQALLHPNHSNPGDGDSMEIVSKKISNLSLKFYINSLAQFERTDLEWVCELIRVRKVARGVPLTEIQLVMNGPYHVLEWKQSEAIRLLVEEWREKMRDVGGDQLTVNIEERHSYW